jgi:competence protein ComGC
MWLGAVILPLHYYAKIHNKISALSFFRYPVYIAAPFYIIGVLFKTMSWVYASELLVISTLLFLFTGSIAFISFLIKQKGKHLWTNTITMIMAFSFAIGVLFKFQSWPYASELILLFVILLFVRIILFLIESPKMNKNQSM